MDAYEFDNMDDARQVELSTLVAIFPEMQIHRNAVDDAYTISLDVPVQPVKAVTVFFGLFGARANTHGVAQALEASAPTPAPQESHVLAHLPPVHVEMVLGSGYPTEEPPRITVSTTPPWLPTATVACLVDDGPRLWEDMGRDTTAYTYIDHIQSSSEDVFGLVAEGGGLEMDAQHKIALLDYDIEAKKAAFARGTYDCRVCLGPKRGTACHSMLDCGHVFCVECLQDVYNKAIKEGNLAAVRCLDPGCVKDREKAAAGKKRKKPKFFLLSPSELLQIPLDHNMVTRYVMLRYKTELEADKKTIYCPRSWCNGAARSKRHRKPMGLDFTSGTEYGEDEADEDEDEDQDEDEDDDHDEEDGRQEVKVAADEETTREPTKKVRKPRLAVCEDCDFAFCQRCSQSWHGEFTPCRYVPNMIMDQHERASFNYISLYTSPCPTCGAPSQKTYGCNHMVCYRCQAHFCYLCTAWLDPSNPYSHFNKDADGNKTGCYQRLWDLEFGDTKFGGAPLEIPRPNGVAVNRDRRVRRPVAVGAAQEVEAEEGHGVVGHAAENPVAHEVVVSREGPLVLRIAASLPVPAARIGGDQAPRDAGVPAREAARRGGMVAAGRGRNPRRALRARPAVHPADEAWIRHFVQLALNDQEDMLPEAHF